MLLHMLMQTRLIAHMIVGQPRITVFLMKGIVFLENQETLCCF